MPTTSPVTTLVNANFKFRVGRRIARHLERPRVRGTLFGRALEFIERSYHNIGSQLEFYGELSIIDRLSPHAPANSIVLDIGANRGQYAKYWLDVCPDISVISFEINPELHQALTSSAAPYGDRWRIEHFGLSDRSGEFPLFKTERSDEVTSLAAIEGLRPSETLARVESAGVYLENLGGSVFLMKIDTEGHELAILEAVVSETTQLPTLIQFEFGHPQIFARCFLSDFFDCLGAEYAVGKIYQGGVDFHPYDFANDELFRMCNYLAVRKSRQDLMDIVAYKG